MWSISEVIGKGSRRTESPQVVSHMLAADLFFSVSGYDGRFREKRAPWQPKVAGCCV